MTQAPATTIRGIVERLLADVDALWQEVARLRQETAELRPAVRSRRLGKRSEQQLAEAIDQALIERPSQTAEEVAGAICARTALVRETLIHGAGVRYQLHVGPPGRNPRAKCWAVSPFSAPFEETATAEIDLPQPGPLDPSRGAGRVSGASR